MYALLRPLLFRLSAETAHELTLEWLGALHRLRLTSLVTDVVPADPVQLWGLNFPNRVGLAAGLDKNADYLDALGALGFGHVEVGTVTPRPQSGNPAPRLFRLPEVEALINRMGFNNHGLDYLVRNLQHRRFPGVVGVNIGKNFDTPVERAAEDYLTCLSGVYPHADYVTVNLSSPNTPGLRALQFGAALEELLQQLVARRDELERQYGRGVPLLVKIAPDMTDDETRTVAAALLKAGIDGAIATNTTVERSVVSGVPGAQESGGLSGAPLLELSNHTLSVLAEAVAGRIPIIGVGGIVNGEGAKSKIRAGASLVQLYSGLIYQGPTLLREVQVAMLGCSTGKSSGQAA